MTNDGPDTTGETDFGKLVAAAVAESVASEMSKQEARRAEAEARKAAEDAAKAKSLKAPTLYETLSLLGTAAMIVYAVAVLQVTVQNNTLALQERVKQETYDAQRAEVVRRLDRIERLIERSAKEGPE